MSGPVTAGAPHRRGATPSQPWVVEPVQVLERYLRVTAAQPRADLIDRIQRRVAQEPPSTAPRRLLVALAAMDGPGIARGLRQSLATAFGPGRRSLLLRAQAGALVVSMVAGIGFGSVAGLAAARRIVDATTRRPPSAQQLVPQSPASALVRESDGPSPRMSHQPTMRPRIPRSGPAQAASSGRDAVEPRTPAPPRSDRRDRGDEERDVSEPDRRSEDGERDRADPDREDENESDANGADEP